MSARYRPGTAAVTGEHRRRPASQPSTASAGSAEMAKIMTSSRKPSRSNWIRSTSAIAAMISE
jgi:hypothetical protein